MFLTVYGYFLFLTIVLSVICLILAIVKKKNFFNLRLAIIIYLLFDVISFICCGAYDMGWSVLYFVPAIVIAAILYIISLIIVNHKIKKFGYIKSNHKYSKILILTSIILILSLSSSFMYEYYMANHCTYLLEFYYSAFLNSKTSYMVIINDKPVELTILPRFIHKDGIEKEITRYKVDYKDSIKTYIMDANYDLTQVENEDIMEIANDAKERFSDTAWLSVYSFPEGKYAIVQTILENNRVYEYFYHNNKLVKQIDPDGELKSIKYYK